MTTSSKGNIPVLITLCEQCTGTSAFLPTIDELPERPLTFQISGIRAGTFEISDIQSLSQWHPFTGEAVGGPLKGRTLKPLPNILERWDQWLANHPDTDVVLEVCKCVDGHMECRTVPALVIHLWRIFFAKVSNLQDRRLPANELVYGVVVGEAGSAIAVPNSRLR